MPRTQRIRRGVVTFPKHSDFTKAASSIGDKGSLFRLRKFFKDSSKLTQKREALLEKLLKRKPQKFYDFYCRTRTRYQALFAELLAGLERCNFKVDMELFEKSASKAPSYSHDFYRIKGISLIIPKKFGFRRQLSPAEQQELQEYASASLNQAKSLFKKMLPEITITELHLAHMWNLPFGYPNTEEIRAKMKTRPVQRDICNGVSAIAKFLTDMEKPAR